MKLTNTQIEAIVNEERRRIDAIHEKLLKDLMNSPEVVKNAKKYMDLIAKIPSDIRACMYIKPTEHAFKEAMVYAKNKKRSNFNVNEYRDMIIIKSIECKTLDELYKKIQPGRRSQ